MALQPRTNDPRRASAPLQHRRAVTTTAPGRQPTFELSLGKLAIVFLAVLGVLQLITDVYVNLYDNHSINWYVSIVWSLYFPIAAVSFVGALASRKVTPATFTGLVHQQVIFLVPTVARFDTLPALQRVVSSILEHAPANLDRFRIDIVTDEGAGGIPAVEKIYAADTRVRLRVVPKAFAT